MPNGDATNIAGLSPITQALIDAQMRAFNASALPVIQNQFALQGLGSSPALGQAVGQSLATAFPGFIQTGEQLGQAQAGLVANIANQEAMRQLQAAQTMAGIYGTLAGQVYNPMAELQQSQAQQALQAFGSAGELQRDIAQQQIDAAQMDFLRRQGLAENATTGIFGSSVLPPTFQQSTTSSGGGK
jgi:hypothetical protein